MKCRTPFLGRLVGLTLLSVCSLASAQTVAGKVTDAISGAAIAKASVTVVEIPKTYTADSAGTFATDTLSKGTFTIRVEASGYLKQSKTVMLVSPTEAGSSHIDLAVKLFSLTTNVDTTAKKTGGMTAQYFFRGHGDVEITICDSTGMVVRKIFDRSRAGGTRTFTWDGKDNRGKNPPFGNYTCKLRSGDLYAQRVLVLKEILPDE
jgi:hypothetical protein